MYLPRLCGRRRHQLLRLLVTSTVATRSLVSLRLWVASALWCHALACRLLLLPVRSRVRHQPLRWHSGCFCCCCCWTDAVPHGCPIRGSPASNTRWTRQRWRQKHVTLLSSHTIVCAQQSNSVHFVIATTCSLMMLRCYVRCVIRL